MAILALLMALNVDPLLEPDHLALAAEHLDRGEPSEAITHLSVHVRHHPAELMTRAYLAELLFQSHRDAESAAEFEAFVSQAQNATGKPQEHLVHCHTRLMALAARSGDDGREHLHRAIGLWRLVRRWQGERRDDAASEATLKQALDEIAAAARLRPPTPVCSFTAPRSRRRWGWMPSPRKL